MGYALKSDPIVGGVVAYGPAGIDNLTGDASWSITVNLSNVPADGVPVGMWQCAGLHIEAVYESSTTWRARAKTFIASGGSITTPMSDPLDLDTEYVLTVTHDVDAEEVNVYVDGDLVATGAAGTRVNALPTWLIALPADSYATNAAVWSSVIGMGPWATPINPTSLGSALKHRYTYENVVTSGSSITGFTDIAGSVDMTTGPGATSAQLTGPAASFSGLDGYANLSTVVPELAACEFTIFFVVTPASTGDFRSVMAVAWYNGGSLSTATSQPWVLVGFGTPSGFIDVAARNNAGSVSGVTAAPTPAENGTGPHVVAIQVKSGVTNGTKVWVDNELQHTGTLTRPAGATTLDSTWLSGRPWHVGGFDDEFQGDFYEAILCDDSLTDEQILGVMSWLHFEHSTVEPPS